MTKDNLLDKYQNLIWKISKKFYGVEKEDLFQAGMLGLLKALNNYKNDGGAKFSTYAVNYIFGEMYLLACNKNIKYGKDVLKLYKTIENARYRLAQKINKIPSNKELALFLDMPISNIEYATMAGNEIMSLDSCDNDVRSYYETITKEDEDIDTQIYIEETLSLLDKSEREIIKSRYYEDLTQQEIALKLNMTQVMVSRYEKRGKEKMKKYMTL